MTINVSNLLKFELNTFEVIEINKNEILTPHLYSEDPMNENDNSQKKSEFEDKWSVDTKLISISESRKHIKEYDAHFSYPGEKVFLKTFNNTTQLGRMNLHTPMIRNVKSRNSIIQLCFINDMYATDTWFSATTSYEWYNCAHVFYGTR